MKKLLCTGLTVLILLTLYSCGSEKETDNENVKENVKENIAVTAEFIDQSGIMQDFSNQPCTVTVLVDSSTVANEYNYLDPNTIYGRIIKSPDEAMLGNCDFEYDFSNGNPISVSIPLSDEALKVLKNVPQKNDIVAASGQLKSINKKRFNGQLPAALNKCVVSMSECTVTKLIPAAEVAAAQRKYKENAAAAQQKQEEENAAAAQQKQEEAEMKTDLEKQQEQQTQNKSSAISYEAAREAFEKYGNAMYPYGFKCHWIKENIMQKQEADGTWSLKVGVTVKNQFGTEQKTIAEGVVKSTASGPAVESFFVY